MGNQIQQYQHQHPELWDESTDSVKLTPSGRSVKTTRAEATKILIPMFDMFPNAQMSEMAISKYVELLQDFEPDLLEKAVNDAIMTSTFLPTVALIRQRAETIRKADSRRKHDAEVKIDAEESALAMMEEAKKRREEILVYGGNGDMIAADRENDGDN